MELEENITTVPLLEEADNLTLNDLLYIVQGLNSDMDRKLSLEKLRDFLQSVFKNITVVGIGNHPDTTTITPSGVTVSGMGGSTEIGKQAVTTTFLSAYSLTLRNSNHTVTLSVNASTNELVIDHSINLDGDITSSGKFIAKSGSTATHNLYTSELGPSGLEIKGPGGTTKITMIALTTQYISAQVLSISGQATIKKLSTDQLILNFTPLEQSDGDASQGQYRSMTNCESHCTSGIPSEYYTAVCPGTSSYQGNSDFTLNSDRHEVGEVILVTNTGKYGGGRPVNHPIAVFQASDTSQSHHIATIEAGNSKQFIYRGKDSNNYPVWTSLN